MRQEATVALHTSQLINANSRMHWRTHARLKETLVQFGRLSLGRDLVKVDGRQRVTFQFTFPTKRRRDRANYHPTVKHLLDGIVRAGVLVDDSDAYIDGPDIELTEELSGRAGFVLVTVTIQDIRGARLAKLAEMEAQIMRDREVALREKEAKKKSRRLK